MKDSRGQSQSIDFCTRASVADFALLSIVILSKFYSFAMFKVL